MRILPINTMNYAQNQTSFKQGYADLSNKILNSNRQSLLEIAEYLHKCSDAELRAMTRSSEKAYGMLKEATDMIKTRKQCYIADGAFQHKVQELDNKADYSRDTFLKSLIA